MKNKILIVGHGDIGAIAAHLPKLHAQGIEVKTYEELTSDELQAITGRNVGDYADRITEIINTNDKELAVLTTHLYDHAETRIQDQFPGKKGGKKNKRNNWNRR